MTNVDKRTCSSEIMEPSSSTSRPGVVLIGLIDGLDRVESRTNLSLSKEKRWMMRETRIYSLPSTSMRRKREIERDLADQNRNGKFMII